MLMILGYKFFGNPPTENYEIQNPSNFAVEKKSQKVRTKVDYQVFRKKNEKKISGITLSDLSV